MKMFHKPSPPNIVSQHQTIEEKRDAVTPLTAAQLALPINRREWSDDKSRTVPANLDRLQQNLDRARTELETQQAELERQATAARQLQDRLCSLNKAVDDAGDRLASVEEQHASFQAQLTSLRTLFLEAWGQPFSRSEDTSVSQ